MARELIEAPPPTEHRLRMSYEEWLAWDGSSGRQTEWVGGEVIVFMPPKLAHQDLLLFLAELLVRFVRRRRLGRVFVAAIEMKLSSQKASREPDILFLATEHLHRVTPERIDGPADLAVEIVSDDSVTRDKRDKRAEYAAAGIPEYWILDPRPGRQRAEFLRLGPDGEYHEGPRDEAGHYHSAVLAGFWLDPAWLWQQPLPDPDDVLARVFADGGERADG
jgi:Uma2 family endonuclease